MLDTLSRLSLSLQAGKTLSERRWNAAFSEDGHLDIEKVLRRIQRGVWICFSFLSYLVWNSYVIYSAVIASILSLFSMLGRSSCN